MEIALISFQFDSYNQCITTSYIDWLTEALRKYEDREGRLPELVLSAGYTCADAAGLTVLEREFGDKPVSLAVELLNPTDNPLTGPSCIKGSGQLYVVDRGRATRLEPRQQFSSTSNVTESRAEKVVAGLAPDGGRRFSIESAQVGWIECGEINVLCCQNDGHENGVRVRYEALEQRFFEAVTSLDMVLNPQHTRMSRLHLLRRKVEALSAGTIIRAPSGKCWPIYVGATNWDRTRQRRSQSNLQCVMRDGRRLPPRGIIETENYILSVFSVDMPYQPTRHKEAPMRTVRLSEILAAVQSAAVIPTLTPEDTGLPMVVCLQTRNANPYGPRIEVSREHGQKMTLDKMVGISISDDPRIVGGGWLSGQDLRLVRAWVLLNEETLLRHWDNHLSPDDMMAALRPLGRPRGRK